MWGMKVDKTYVISDLIVSPLRKKYAHVIISSINILQDLIEFVARVQLQPRVGSIQKAL